jgi:hypothetical protein
MNENGQKVNEKVQRQDDASEKGKYDKRKGSEI